MSSEQIAVTVAVLVILTLGVAAYNFRTSKSSKGKADSSKTPPDKPWRPGK